MIRYIPNPTKDVVVNSEGRTLVALDEPIDTIINSTSGNSLDINDEGQAHIVARGHNCTTNSTETLLLADEVFTGDAEDILDYNGIVVFITSDVDSAVKGLKIQFSKDGLTNWRTSEDYTVLAGAEKWFTPPTFGSFFRIVYTNGSTDQTAFEITTTLRKMPFKWSSHNIEDPIKDQDDAELVKAVITGKKSNGDFDNASLTNGGNFKTSIEEFESGVSTNSNSQLNVSPYILDEFGNYSHILGDSIFRGAIIAISPEHHEIHCGDSYEATVNEDLGNGGVLDILIVVPNETPAYPSQLQKLYHFKDIIEVESECTLEFYEGTTVSANGVAVNSYNRNRNSTLTDTLGIFTAPTITTVGTMLWGPWVVGSGRSIGGDRGRSNEFVLKNNETYLLRITNNTTTACQVNVEMDYYVHPGV